MPAACSAIAVLQAHGCSIAHMAAAAGSATCTLPDMQRLLYRRLVWLLVDSAHGTVEYNQLLYSQLLYSQLLYSQLLYSQLLYSQLLYSQLLYSQLLYRGRTSSYALHAPVHTP
jgi:hypothetical protein